MRLMCALVVLSAAMVSPSYGAAERGERIQAAGEAAEPFRVGNIYSVGGQYGSYLITTPDPHSPRHGHRRHARAHRLERGETGSTYGTSGS